MSEQGWQNFLIAEGLGDWAVLHGGAVAVFRVQSIGEAVRVADRIANVPGIAGAGLLLTLADDRVTVRLTRDLWALETHHIGLARSISAVAHALGSAADRSSIQEVQVAIAARPSEINVDFWRAVLGYSPMADDNAVDPLGHGSTVWMQELKEEKPLRHAMHIDVSVPREHVEARLEAAVAAGGRVVDASHAPAHWTLSDPAGNRVCICAWPDGSASGR
jgi:4a-hydroxytetrahydrobiopterin dehydratase